MYSLTLRGKSIFTTILANCKHPVSHCMVYSRNASSNPPKPIVAAKNPFCVTVTGGKRFSWCSCGLSQKQPFCDGSHRKTGMRPLRHTLEETCEVYLCGCKQTDTPPFCDGSHMNNEVQKCNIGDTL